MRDKPLKKETRRKLVAAKVVATGKPLSRIAEELGVTRATVSADFNSPETKDIIQSMLAKRDAKLESLIDKSIDAIDSGLGALKGDEADHSARMRAAAEAARILNLRAGRSNGDSDSREYKFKGQLEVLLADYRRITAAPPETH